MTREIAGIENNVFLLKLIYDYYPILVRITLYITYKHMYTHNMYMVIVIYMQEYYV